MILAVPILDDLRKAVAAEVAAGTRSQRKIALAAGIHPNTMTAFMQGRRGLKVETAEDLAKALGMPLAMTKRKGAK